MASTSYGEPPCIDIEVDVEEAPVSQPAPALAPAPADPSSTPSTDDLGSNPVIDLLHQVIHNQDNFNQQNGWPMWVRVTVGAAVVAFVIALIIVVAFLSIHAIRRRGGGGGGGGEDKLGCVIQITVSKDGRSNFSKVSDAVEASPDDSPVKVCIFVGAGEYQESVTVGEHKKNLALIGEGSDTTIISSNTTSNGTLNPESWPGATLSAYGDYFVAQDLAVRTGLASGVAVANTAKDSTFFRCKFEGANMTVHIRGAAQFYRDCQFHGKTYLLYGRARAYFQKCQFLGEKSSPDERIVFTSQSSRLTIQDTGYVFHLCEFHIVGAYANYSRTAFLSSTVGEYASIAIIQSYLDPLLAGYLYGTPANVTVYNIFGNTGLSENLPYFVHLLRNRQDASMYSLKHYLDGNQWIAKGVDYDLDLAE